MGWDVHNVVVLDDDGHELCEHAGLARRVAAAFTGPIVEPWLVGDGPPGECANARLVPDPCDRLGTVTSMVMEDWVPERELWSWTRPPWFAPRILPSCLLSGACIHGCAVRPGDQSQR